MIRSHSLAAMAVCCILLSFSSCGSSDTKTTTPADKPAEPAPAPAATETASDAVKDAYYEFTAPADWNKPVSAGESKIYSVKLDECSCSFIPEMVNPKNKQWVAGTGDMTLDELLSKQEEKLKEKDWNSIITQTSAQINGQNAAFIEYTVAEHDGHPNEHKRLYYFKKNKAVVSVMVSATAKCWDRFLPVAESALNGMKML